VRITRKEKIKAAVSMKRDDEPMTDGTKLSLMKALNHYRSVTDKKVAVKWAQSWVKTNAPKYVARLGAADDFDVATIGILTRLVSRGHPLPPEVPGRIQTLLETLPTPKKVAPVEQAKSVNSVPVENTDLHVAMDVVNGELDAFLQTKTSSFSLNDYFVSAKTKPAIQKLVIANLQGLLAELQAVLEGDPDLQEGWKNITRPQVKRYVAWLEEQVKAKTKVVRKPRKVKAVPASKVVSKVNYQKDAQDLGIVSVSPEKLVGASEVWVLNTKYRKIVQIVGDITVKGSTINGIDWTKSKAWGVRKLEVLKGVSMTKGNLQQLVKTLKPKEHNSGRMTPDTLILVVK